MRVEPLVPDSAAPPPGASSPSAFAGAVDAAADALARADRAETAFAAHRGGLQELVVERARADIVLQIASTGAQRTAQAVQTLLGMQI